MVEERSDSERRNQLSPHRLISSLSSALGGGGGVAGGGS